MRIVAPWVWGALLIAAMPAAPRADEPSAAGAPAGRAAVPPSAGAITGEPIVPSAAVTATGKSAVPPSAGLTTEQPAAPPPAPAQEAPDRVAEEREGGPARRKARAVDLAVKGRVFLDLTMDERRAWDRELALGSARVALEGRVHGILTVLEAELASRSLVRDAYVRLDGPFTTRLHAGRFKAPFSIRELASSWKLPLAARGLVNDYVVERNGLGGRQLGAMASARPWSGRLEVELGAFTAPPPAANERTREDLAAAVYLRPWRGLEVGATAYQANAAEDGRRAGTAHVRLDLGPLAAAVEGMAGRLREGAFTAGTALAWWEQPLGRAWRAGPVLGAEALRLRDGTGATGWAATAGAVLHHVEGLKVTLEGERARRPGDAAPRDAVRLRLGARF